MGTNTDFTGAIRITPCVEEPLATRLSQFMDIRHMKRDGKISNDAHNTFETDCYRAVGAWLHS